jgi:N-acetylglutamate synthase
MPATTATIDLALARRVEEASLNAWPALHQLLLDGWVLRFARGFTKRANSVVPVYPSTRDALEPGAAAALLREKVRFCENLYTRENLATIFRLTTLGEQVVLDDLLAARGYARVDPTLVMVCALDERDDATADGFAALPQAEWLDAYGDITGAPSAARALHGLVLNGIRTPLAFGLLRKPADARAVACGIAVLEADLVGLFDVATLATERRQGFARMLVRALLAWGAAHGARSAYLQVVEENHGACALYRQLGFAPLYRYWYRVAPR